MGEVLNYKAELLRSMRMLAEDTRVVFIGQTVEYPGSAIYRTLEGVDINKRIEVPVFEDTQMGMSIGLNLAGFIPVSIFPRFDFLLLATNQLVNHLDKIEEMSCGQYKPKVIIRTCVGSKEPLNPGLQHCGDYTEAFNLLLKTIPVVILETPYEIYPSYQKALSRKSATLLVELGDLSNAVV